RVRGRAGYTQACNSFFQGLAADGLKEALWLIAEEMYSPESKSALAGSFMVVEAHDEIIMESPRQTAHEAATRLQELMVQGMKKFCPDVPINAQPVLMERWYKGAKPVYNAEKRLIPWRPKEK
ncbi:MAG: DNA polymerase I, partial [Flavobacteriales bacterium]|nr:DNA polymerase I [Flavobacteriales bacterium]